jgi:hypothetical protein
METRPIFVLLALLLAAGAFAEAYTWTDENGIVHYSDRPHPGAKIIQLDESNATRSRRATRSSTASSSASDNGGDSASPGYSSLDIASPGAEETLWNIEGILNVSVAVSPGLQRGHRIRPYFDGEAKELEGTNFQIPNVYRGVHNLQAEIVDSTGRVILRSQANRFYVQQNTVVR